jgi:hypothetical protein
MMETILHILSKDTGEKGGQEGEDPTKENMLFTITAASAIAKGMGKRR